MRKIKSGVFYNYPRDIRKPDTDWLDNSDDQGKADIERLAAILANTPCVPKADLDKAKSTLTSADLYSVEEQQVAHMITWFAAHVLNGEPIEQWLLEELAIRLLDTVTAQCELSETMPLPWARRPRLNAQERDYLLFGMAKELQSDGLNVTTSIERAGQAYALGVDAARVAYYREEKRQKEMVLAIKRLTRR